MVWRELILKHARFTAVRSSGPGGQNVNMRNSKAVMNIEKGVFDKDLLCHVSSSIFKNHDTTIKIASHEERSFELNSMRCINKLEDMLKRASDMRALKEQGPCPERLARIETYKRQFKLEKSLMKAKVKIVKAGRQKPSFDS